MNQIIIYKDIMKDYKDLYYKQQKIYKTFFIISITVLIISIIYYIFRYIKISNQSKISEKVLNQYNIQSLYNSNRIELPSIITESGDMADILGVLQIDKINLKYPILSKYSDELLEVALCKFAGNDLNDYGNFCILGHNYSNDYFFSNLNLVNIGDIIELYCMNGSHISYIIYDKYEIFPTDLTCTIQDYSIKEVTLITCTNKNDKRLVLKAKEKR